MTARCVLCTECYYAPVPAPRLKLGRTTCMTCGEKLAREVRHTVAPMSKSNYMLIRDPALLKQLNPKRTV